jgi:hypothetical protein
MYICTDGPVSFFDDGAAWQPIKIFGGMTSPALVSTFTAINAGGRAITATDVKGTLSMVMTNGIGADDFRILKKAVTPLTTYSLIVHMYPTLVNTNYSGAGVCFRESSSGKTSHFGVIMSGGTVNIIWRNETANNTGASPTFTTGTDIVGLTADTGFVDFNLSQNGIWLKISDDGVNRTASYCVHDDLDWIQFGSVGRTVTFTADEVGLWVGNANNTGTAASAKAVFDSVSLAA